MTGRFDQKVAVVTGAGSGFGRATTTLLATEGASVVIGELDVSGAEQTAAEVEAIGGRCELVIGDVADAVVARSLADRAMSAFGRLDVLVNNAGVRQDTQADSWNLEDDEWDRIIRTNLRSVYVCSRAAIPVMVEGGGGSIVNVSSIGASVAIGGAAYCASKGGMVSYTQHVAAELAPQNVRVNCVAPGIMRTPMSTGERRGLTPEQQNERIATMGTFVPFGRCGSVDDIANAILFLASDDAGYITGQELIVDGGYVVRAKLVNRNV